MEYEMANIGMKDEATLRRTGLVGLAGAMALGVAAIYYQVSWWVRPTLFVLLWFGVARLLQARSQALRQQARLIQRRSLFVAAFVVSLLVLC